MKRLDAFDVQDELVELLTDPRDRAHYDGVPPQLGRVRLWLLRLTGRCTQAELRRLVETAADACPHCEHVRVDAGGRLHSAAMPRRFHHRRS